MVTCACPGDEHRGEPLPVAARVWAALNRRLFYILIINGFMGRSGEWVSLLRADVIQFLMEDKDYIVCDKPTSMQLL